HGRRSDALQRSPTAFWWPTRPRAVYAPADAANGVSSPWRIAHRRAIVSTSRKRGARIMGSIVCGVTASDEARDAAHLAASLADELGTRLVLAHVVEIPELAADSVTASRERAEAERMLTAVGRELAV